MPRLSTAPSSRVRRSLIPVVAGGLLLTGCGSSSSGASNRDAGNRDAGDGSTVSVVATTNVYAAVATAIAGKDARVTAILSDPSADPHSFEVSAQDQVTIAKAQLVIANGGGYDDFANTMVEAANPKPELIDVVQLSGLDQHPKSGEFNEHVFYNLDTITTLGTALAGKLGALDPADKQTFTANAAAFAGKLAALKKRAIAIGTAHPGLKAIVTEPVADYLLQTAGISDVTPTGFSQAVEEENDPAPADVAQVDQLLASKSIAVLVFNSQTSGAVTEDVKKTAQADGVPVLPVTETLPAGVTDYPTWMGDTITALGKVLG
ncbi:MAG: metal ABC transporter solute-binding protein, Zn/Mn family [Nakamurella sp.]